MPRIECPLASCKFYAESNDGYSLVKATESHVLRSHPDLKLSEEDLEKLMIPEKAPRD